MRIYRKRRYNLASINTSSLPDLIFTILFFFMLVTSMRQYNVQVAYKLPQGDKLTKNTSKANISHIYIGKPIAQKNNHTKDTLVIQLNDKIVTLEELTTTLATQQSQNEASAAPKHIIYIRADKKVPMGMILDINQKLRSINLLNVHFLGTNQTF